MSAEVSKECPEMVLLALEDLTIEIKLLEQMMLGIAAMAESVTDPVVDAPAREQQH